MQPIDDSPTDPAELQLDAEGIPLSSPVPEWLDLVGSDKFFERSGTRWLQAILRFTRPDGSSVFDQVGRDPDRLARLASLATRLGDPSLIGVVARWLPARSAPGGPTSPLPFSFDSRPDRPLAILRDDWDPRGDLVAIDHRATGATTLLEVASRGQTWLGPDWTSNFPDGKVQRSQPTSWSSEGFAFCAEWSFKVGNRRVTRLATLLRGRSMALLGQQVDAPSPVDNEVRFRLPEGIEAATVPGSRALVLSSGRGKPTARLIPLGLPSHDRPTDRGSIAVEGREVVIRQISTGKRQWLPILICWGKPPTTWRPLSVAFRSKNERDDVAVAARVAFGRGDDGLVVYRSLAPPALRCFLGHQTRARFVVGTFPKSGDLRPILKID